MKFDKKTAYTNLIKEENDLVSKLVNLSVILGKKPAGISDTQKHLMYRQYSAMIVYRDILSERIDDLEAESDE